MDQVDPELPHQNYQKLCVNKLKNKEVKTRQPKNKKNKE